MFEAGTPNIAGNSALGEATAEFMEIADDAYVYEAELLKYTEERLREIPRVNVLGQPHERAGAVGFTLEGAHYYDAAVLLDKLGIAVRSGHHCAQPLMNALGVTGTLRVSPAYYNTKEEIDYFIDSPKRVLSILGGKGR